jgi:hypothetical protein
LDVHQSLVLANTTRQLASLSTTTLDADPLVAAVAGAEEEDWQRRFHRLWGRGLMGSFNLAIKMEKGPSEKTFPEFTLKGLSFDPSDVARMASRVTSQALALGAKLAGVPLTGLTEADSPPAGAVIAAVTSPVAARQAEVTAGEHAARSHNAALQSLAVATLQSWSDLTNADAATRKAAIAGLRATYAALQPSLRTPATAASDAVEEAEQEEETPEDDQESEQPEDGEESADEEGENGGAA